MPVGQRPAAILLDARCRHLSPRRDVSGKGDVWLSHSLRRLHYRADLLPGRFGYRNQPRWKAQIIWPYSILFCCQLKVVVVKSTILICLCLTMLGCAASNGVDYRNFAIDTYSPTMNEIQLAERRARNYWARNGARLGPEPRYLAVDTSNLFPYGGLYPKLINSETTAGFFSRVSESTWYSDLVLKGVTIYDTKTGHIVDNRGYVSVDTPNPGQVARFGDYMARWIGTGGLSFF